MTTFSLTCFSYLHNNKGGKEILLDKAPLVKGLVSKRASESEEGQANGVLYHTEPAELRKGLNGC